MATSHSDQMDSSDKVVAPGTVLGDRYEVIEEIGRGGFGRILRAKQLNVNRDVAVKVLPPKFTAMSDVVQRFEREARLASQLQHPNTVTLHDYGTHDDLLFIVLELLEGNDLGDLLQNQRRLEPKLVRKIGIQSLKSLNEAHKKGIIHRDLKPENIFLAEVGDDDNFVKILDFGIAKLKNAPMEAAKGDRPKLTVEGNTVGTPTYMAPEQASGGEVTAQSDLYSLGIILYEIANGRPPYDDEEPSDIMRSHIFDDIPGFIREDLQSTPFEEVVLRSIAKDKEDRYDSATEFLEALEQTDIFGESTTPGAKPTEQPESDDESTQDFLEAEPTDQTVSPRQGEAASSVQLEPGEYSGRIDELTESEKREFGTSSSILTVVESGSDDDIIVLDDSKQKRPDPTPSDADSAQRPDESDPYNSKESTTRKTPLSSELDITPNNDDIELEDSDPYATWQLVTFTLIMLGLVAFGIYIAV